MKKLLLIVFCLGLVSCGSSAFENINNRALGFLEAKGYKNIFVFEILDHGLNDPINSSKFCGQNSSSAAFTSDNGKGIVCIYYTDDKTTNIILVGN